MTRIVPNQCDADRIEQLCQLLFDGWCERRSVIPLAYLMHVWPLLTAGPLKRIRLQRTLQDLKQFHAHLLTQDDHRVIAQVLAIPAHAEKNNPGANFS